MFLVWWKFCCCYQNSMLEWDKCRHCCVYGLSEWVFFFGLLIQYFFFTLIGSLMLNHLCIALMTVRFRSDDFREHLQVRSWGEVMSWGHEMVRRGYEIVRWSHKVRSLGEAVRWGYGVRLWGEVTRRGSEVVRRGCEERSWGEVMRSWGEVLRSINTAIFCLHMVLML